MLYAPGLHFGFNFPAFLIVMLLTMVLVRGIRESAEANNTMVILKIAAILAFIIAGSALHPSGNWHPFAPNGLVGHPDRWLDHFLHLHRLRLGLDRRRRSARIRNAICRSESSPP